MNGPNFNGGDEFIKLWAQVPKIVNYQDYVDMANEIDSARMDRIITDRDEQILMEALESVKKWKRIKPRDRD